MSVRIASISTFEAIAFDRMERERRLTRQLDGDGFTMVPFGQGFQSMAAPTEELRKLLVGRSRAWRQ